MIIFLLCALFFVAGICVGSFCGVLLEGDIKNRSFWTGRSQCSHCKNTLKWYELIPVISYIIQGGKCRHCGKKIPSWVFRIEWIMGLVWMIFGTLLISNGYSYLITALHLLAISCLVILAVEDARSMTIPDRLSLPMMVIIFMIVSYARLYQESSLFPIVRWSLLGGFLGLLFYSLQIMVPAIFYEIQHKRFRNITAILSLPLVFPFWGIVKLFSDEDTADKLISSLKKVDTLPAWVGGGDLRLGIIVGMITGPFYLLWVIMIGYCSGTLYWLVMKIFVKKNLTHIPVAPLLLVGLCVTWLLRLFHAI